MRFYEVKCVNNLSEKEINALKYYIGDVEGNHPFYGDGKAYVVLNSLFFPDIHSEKMRAAEGKYLNPAIIAEVPRLLDFFNSIFSVFGKSLLKQSCTAYRVERMADFEICRSLGRTVSLTSTSTAGFLDAYRDRRGIALMKFNLSEGSHIINVAEILDFYAKPEEAEILLPPFVTLDIRDLKLTDEQRCITDCDGNQPITSVEVNIGDICDDVNNENIHISDCDAGIRVYDALNCGKIPDIEDISEYSQWKKSLQRKLYYIFRQYML